LRDFAQLRPVWFRAGERPRHLDKAYAFEALARAARIAHDRALSAEYLGQARALGQQVEDAEERQMLLDDLDNIQR